LTPESNVLKLRYLILIIMSENLQHYAEADAKSQEATEMFKGQSVDAILEQQAIIDKARSRTQSATGLDLRQSKVDNLDGNTAGLYHTGTRKIDVDAGLIAFGTLREVERVMQHEAKHHQNITAGKGERIATIEVEEALTEMAAAREDGGQAMAYKDYVSSTKLLIAKTNHSVPEMLDLYCEGKNAEINRIIAGAANKNSLPTALAA